MIRRARKEVAPQRTISPVATLPQPGPEHALLARMTGEFHVDMTFCFEPGGPLVRSVGRSSTRIVLGGLFLEERLDGAWGETQWTTLSLTGFNASTRLYQATRIASTNTIAIWEQGAYNAGSGRLDLRAEYPFAGEIWRQRSLITPSPEPSVDVYVGHADVPDWKGTELRYRRR